MRLEVFCEDRLGLTRELLDLQISIFSDMAMGMAALIYAVLRLIPLGESTSILLNWSLRVSAV